METRLDIVFWVAYIVFFLVVGWNLNALYCWWRERQEEERWR